MCVGRNYIEHIEELNNEVPDEPIFFSKPNSAISEKRRFMSLDNGDIVMTGTPKGVGVINAGDIFCGKVMDNDSLITSVEWLAT